MFKKKLSPKHFQLLFFLPLECLELKQQVCPQSKILGDDATRNVIKVTAVRQSDEEAVEKVKVESR